VVSLTQEKLPNPGIGEVLVKNRYNLPPIVACKVFLTLLEDRDNIGLSPIRIRWDFASR
jgi:hypothetical protein